MVQLQEDGPQLAGTNELPEGCMTTLLATKLRHGTRTNTA